MANIRIKDQTTDTALVAGDYVIVDNETEGTRKFDLGQKLEDIDDDFTDVKADLGDLDNLQTAVKTDLVSAINEAAQSGGTGMSEDFKQALHDILEKVAYIDEDGQDYLDALDSAMWPPADLVSISAVYTQSGTVYDTDSLDSLKSDLVVTAHFSDGTAQTVTTYTLSGTLTEGTSTITVFYGGKTTTFNVTVTHAVPSYITDGLIHHWDAIDNTSNGHDSSATVWEDLVGTNNLTVNNPSHISWESNAVAFDGTSGTRFMASEDATTAENKTVEVVFSVLESQASTLCTPFYYTANPTDAYGKVIIFADDTFNVSGKSETSYETGLLSITDLHSISASWNYAYSKNKVFANAVEAIKGSTTHSLQGSDTKLTVGASPTAYGYPFKGKIHSIRIYGRKLTQEEVAQNYAVDVARFGLGA